MKRFYLTSTILTATGLGSAGLSLTAALIASTAAAQQTFDLGTIVLSSSLSPVELGRTGATVEVLEGDDVGKNDTTVVDRLNRLPGISSSANGGVGSSTNLRIRGLGAQYIGVRINGIDVTDPSDLRTGFDFGGMLSSGIDRIEVLKGSQSALYGSEAIAGVINITTFRPEKLGFSGRFDAEAGSFDTYSGTLSLGFKTLRGEIALSYGRYETDGISALAAEPERDGYDQQVLNLTGEYDVTEILAIGGAVYYRDRETSYDSPPSGAAGLFEGEERGARVFSTLSTETMTHTLSYSYSYAESDYQTRYREGERNSVSYLGSAQLGTQTLLNFGAEYTEEAYKSGPISASEQNTGVNAELLFSPTDRIDVSASLRYDDNSTFSGKTTGRVAAVWRPVEDLAFRAVVGTGFRAPSLNERFGPFGANPNLKPEQSVSYELGVEKTFGAVGTIRAMVFYTDIDDLIDYIGAGYTQVAGTSTSEGIEISGEYAVTSDFSVFSNYTYTNARDEKGARRARVPQHDLVVGLSNDFTDRFSGYVDVRHVADVVASNAANTLSDYTVVGAGISYDVTPNAELYLRLENIFDEDYQTAFGYNQPGRAAYVGLRASF
jgi:vitamin B12 transporter